MPTHLPSDVPSEVPSEVPSKVNEHSASSSAAVNQAPGFWAEPWFWLSLAAGLLVWVSLWWLGVAMTTSLNLSLLTFVLSVLVYPVLEEIVFRGWLQEWLLTFPVMQASKLGFTVANGVTSGIFAAFHLFSQSPLWAASILFPSLVFGWLRDRYDSLLPGVLVHMFYNAGLLLLFG